VFSAALRADGVLGRRCAPDLQQNCDESAAQPPPSTSIRAVGAAENN